jgi:hypothetical protein
MKIRDFVGAPVILTVPGEILRQELDARTVVFAAWMHYPPTVPSQLHDVLVKFFRIRPELAPTLLSDALGVEVPHYTEAPSSPQT